jgi:hypothetical protein
MSTTPAGWYPDPSGKPGSRYWDGSVWTKHIHAPAVERVTLSPSLPSWWPIAAGVAALVVILGLAAVVKSSTTDKTHTISGSLTLDDEDTYEANCFGTGGYDDIHVGATVTIKDGAGTIIATGELGPGGKIGAYDCRYQPWRRSRTPTSTRSRCPTADG